MRSSRKSERLRVDFHSSPHCRAGQAAEGGTIRSGRVRWGVLLVALIVVAAVALLAVRWHETGFDWRRFGRTLVDVRWPWLAGAVGFVILTYYGRVLRWAVMIRPLCPHPSHWRLFSATVVGFTAVVLLGRPGEFVRPYLIARKESLPISSQMAAWLLERIYDILIVLLIFAFSLTQIPNGSIGPRLQWVLEAGGYMVGVITMICLAILIVLRWFADTARTRLLDALRFLPQRAYESAAQVVDAFIRGVQSTRSTSATVLLFVYTLLEWLIIAACYFCIFEAFPVTAGHSWQEVLTFLGFVSFGSIVQIPGVGGGMQIVAVLVLTEFFHIPLEPATGIALFIWVITFVVVVPFGLLLAFHDGLNWRKLKSLEAESSL